MSRSEAKKPTVALATEDERRLDLSFVRRCTTQAAEAILGLWDQKRQTFWRHTTHRERELKASKNLFFPTVSLRCVDALLCLIVESPDWAPNRVREMLTATVVPSIVKRDEKLLESTLNAPAEKKVLNVFTLSLYVQTFSRILSHDGFSKDIADAAQAKLRSAAKDLLRHSTFKKDGPVTAHPFILYHASRALILSASRLQDRNLSIGIQKLVGRITAGVRDSIVRMLAKQMLGSSNPSEAVALAFCAATLTLCGLEEDHQYILAALDSCFEAQDASGCWPLGRVVRENKDIASDRLEIPTYEIAWVIAETLIQLVDKTGQSLSAGTAKKAVQRLLEGGRYAERSIVHLPGDIVPRRGWCSEHAYGVEIIESWTSATVLQSMLSLNRLMQEAARQTILSKYTVVSPTDRNWPSWLRWNRYVTDNEPDHDHPALKYLNEKIVKPILDDPRGLPPSNPRSVSALLFGPPGTSKTTIVKAVADGLGWPVVLLNPGNFIEHGLESIEAQARLVFDDLMELSRAVVIFDECDELFRDREPRPGTEQTRGITAFVTASMLPKLQELHDRGRVIFFICSNKFESIDPAVKRGGRIDHIVGVGSPDKEARIKIIRATWQEFKQDMNWVEPKHFAAAMEELALMTERFTRSEIQRAARLLARSDGWADVENAKIYVRSVLNRLKEALTIGLKEYDAFQKQKNQFSQPVTEGV